jgi:hypothetical protein
MIIDNMAHHLMDSQDIYPHQLQKNTLRKSAMILDNQWMIIDNMAHHLYVSCGFAHGISLGFTKFVQDGFENNSGEHNCNCLTGF